MVGDAVLIGRIAVGDEQDTADDSKAHHREGGRKGGTARASKLSPERRAEITRQAAAKRWKP